MRPVACFVTSGSAAVDPDGAVARIAAVASGGVDLIQVREPALDARALFDLVQRCVAAVRGTRARLLVNDRLDVALAAGAHGLHLRAGSMPAVRVRQMAPRGFLVGRSVHDAASAEAAASRGSLDYLTFGTVFATASKPGRVPAGVHALAAVTALTPLPVLAIGGMNRERLEAVSAAGAAGFSAIGLFADAPLADLPALVREARQAFERGRAGSGASGR